MNDERFDDALQEMRDEAVSPKQVAAAQERVSIRLAKVPSLACDDFRPDLAGYAAGTLPEARRMLAEDHLSRCVDCRHALAEVKGERKVIEMPPTAPRRVPTWTRWAVAAGVVFAVLYIGRSGLDSAFAPSGPRASVVSISGTLYQPSGTPLQTGAELADGEVIRTAAGSHAVLQLRDGTLVEMNQRTELAVCGALSGDTIRLEFGDIIVIAAEQGRGRLRVVTRDTIASVKGTVFAVSSGTAGSLVFVVEGSVEVTHSGFDDLLRAGQQAASSPALAEVGMMQAISWSQNAAAYYGLVAELAQIEQELALTGMRREARLVPYLPTNTSVYFAIPNLDGTIEEAIRLLDEHATSNATLRDWWLSDSGQSLRETLKQLQGVATLLGEELVLVLTGSEEPMGLFLAEVRPGSHDELQRMIEAATDEASEDLPFQITEDLLLVSDSSANLALLSAQLGGGGSSAFAVEIADHYRRGVGWLAAIDVSNFKVAFGQEELSRMLSLSSMRFLFVEQRSGTAGDESEATLSFSGNREGMASWLAGAGSIGSAEYVSGGAIAASAASTRDPREAFDQLLSLGGSDFTSTIKEIEEETGIDVRDDIASSLGTDFVIAIEGMAVTEPLWVAVFEVLNPGALDAAVRRVVDAVNANMDAADDRVTFTEENVNGRTWKMLASTEVGSVALSWTYDRGYLVVSTDRATAMRAISVRDSASSLIRSSRFLRQFPSGSGVHSSGFLWLDIGRFGEVIAALGGESLNLGNGTEPVLIVVTGEDDQIRWASRSRLTSRIFDFLLM